MRKIKIDLGELEMAFENHEPMLSYYLDTETGDIINVNDEIRSQLQEIYGSYRDEQTQEVNWALALEEVDIPEWEWEVLKEADGVERGYGERYIAIPEEESSWGYGDMEAFIETVSDRYLQNKLESAIIGRGVFRRFRNTLSYHLAERDRWFQFKRDRLRSRMLEWLEGKDLQYDAGET